MFMSGATLVYNVRRRGGGGSFGLWYEDHAEGDQCAMGDEISEIFGTLESSGCAGNTERKSHAAADTGSRLSLKSYTIRGARDS